MMDSELEARIPMKASDGATHSDFALSTGNSVGDMATNALAASPATEPVVMDESDWVATVMWAICLIGIVVVFMTDNRGLE